MNLANKKILLVVSGGIAAYKACELTRLLIKEKAEVRVAMTKSACEFVSPLTFETLSNHEVMSELFPKRFIATQHIDWADWADGIIVAPATANIIGKLANGIYDDIATTIISASLAPKLIAPAMNSNMWGNAIVQENIQRLEKHDFSVMGTSSGELACGWIGEGRLADLEEIIQYSDRLFSTKTLAEKKILVSSGGTIEDIDPVRYLSNRSTGKMGNALAYAAWVMGADVRLISAQTKENIPYQIKSRFVRSADDMLNAVQAEFGDCDIFISAAAVADYSPEKYQSEKLKKSDVTLTLKLKRSEDILSSLKKKDGQKIIAFALETEKAEENAIAKMKRKDADAIVLNNPKQEGAAFAHDTNVASMFFPNGKRIDFEKQSKLELAFKILEQI